MMIRSLKKPKSIACTLTLLTIVLFLNEVPDYSAAQEKESTWPSSVTVTYGTATGIIDYVVGQDGVTYSVAEEDVNTGRDYDNTTLNPDGLGTYTEWDNAVGGISHFTCVDEGPPSPGDENITYVMSAPPSVDETDTYSIQDFTFPAGHDVIDEVRVSGVASTVALAFADTYSVCVYSGLVLDCGAENLLSPAWVNYTATWTTNPDGGIPWVLPDVDSLEAGHHLWLYDVGNTEDKATLLFATVQSNGPIDDYTADFQFSFTGIDHKYKPVLEVSGYRTGDAENIMVQFLREGAFSTLSANALTTGLATVQYQLSTADVIGGVASVRIVDADNTDNTQTTIYIDEILIRTEGNPPGPSVPIKVWTQSEYDLWGNRLIVNLFWAQSGGPEPADVISKFLAVYIDGYQVGEGFIQIPLDKNMTFVAVPWSALDGGLHNATIFGYVVVAWTSGTVAYRSDAENIQLNNFHRWCVLVLIFLIVVVLLVIIIIRYFSRRQEEREYLREKAERREE